MLEIDLKISGSNCNINQAHNLCAAEETPYIHNGNHHCFHYKIHTIIFFTPAFPCNSDYTDDIAAGTQTTAFIERWFGLKS